MRGLIAAFVTTAALGLPVAALSGPSYRLLRFNGDLVKWGEPRLGTPSTVSWGLADHARAFPDAINCGSLAPFDSLRIADDPAMPAIVAAAFGLWGDAAGVHFRRAGPGETPDILIGAQGEPDHVAFANVWTDHERAVAGVAPLTHATICFNPALAWVPDAAGPGEADFGTVLAHEIGHTLGLDHPGPTGALMGYSDQGDIDTLMHGDVAGVMRLYGPPQR